MTENALILVRECERIRGELALLLPVHEAAELTAQIADIALDIDEEIAVILRDPLSTALYNYDGQFFAARRDHLFHTAFDGQHVFQWLTTSVMRAFFTGRPTQTAVAWLMEEVEKHRWMARTRRMNWEQYRTLSILPHLCIEQEPDHSCVPDPLSPEEETFFKSLGMN